MKSYRTVDEVLSDRRKGTKLSEVVESILNSPYVLERIDTPFEIIQGLHPGDYLDASTEAWRELPVELQIKYSSAYQRWYAYYSGHASIEGTFDLAPGVETTMMFIPPTKYLMGGGLNLDEPIIETFVAEASWMGKCEVTQAEWLNVMRDNPSRFQDSLLCPVDTVSYEDCQEFCEKTGMRLPHEDIWELACRAGTTTDYNFGDARELLERYAWFYENSDYETHNVGTREPNAWGLYDTLGNVWEWCENKYSFDLDDRVRRGGGYGSDAYACRPAYRNKGDISFRGYRTGFRIWRAV